MSGTHLLLLHGLGGDRNAMLPVTRRLGRRIPQLHPHTLEGDFWEFPADAPQCGWFEPPNDRDRRLGGPHWKPPRHLDVSVARVHGALRDLLDRGVPPHRVFLVGHSQGAALAIAAGMTFSHALGGVCSLAGYLTLPHGDAIMPPRTRYLLQHANQDSIVHVRWAHYAAQYLASHGLPCELRCWDDFHRPHAMLPGQIDCIAEWITQCLNGQSAAAEAS